MFLPKTGRKTMKLLSLVLALAAAAVLFGGCKPPKKKAQPPRAPAEQQTPATKQAPKAVSQATAKPAPAAPGKVNIPIPAVKRTQLQNDQHNKDLEKAMEN